MSALVLCLTLIAPANAKKEDLTVFLQSNDSSVTQIDHGLYQEFLSKNWRDDLPSGIAGFDYKNVNDADKQLLKDYLKQMGQIDIAGYNSAEQKAFWLNIYNAVALDLILDFHPIATIRDIEITSGMPVWQMQRFAMMGHNLSLDNIQHDILREKFTDWRLLNGLNIGALSAGAWQAEPYQGLLIDAQLDQAVTNLFTHPLSAQFIKHEGKLILRLVAGFKWYEDDMQKSNISITQILQKYGTLEIRQNIDMIDEIEYFYDWRLNQL